MFDALDGFRLRKLSSTSVSKVPLNGPVIILLVLAVISFCRPIPVTMP
jgi:hypothetical protein